MKPAQPSQSRAQVGMDCSGLGMQLQKLSIFCNRALKITRLLFLHGVLHQLLGGHLCLRGG